MSDAWIEDSVPKQYDHRLVVRFLAYLRPYAGQVALAFGLIVATVGAGLAGPLLLRAAIDGPVARGDARGLFVYAALFAGTILAVGLTNYFEHVVTVSIGQKILRDLRCAVFDHLQRLPVAFFDRNPTGRLVVRVTNDVESLTELFTSGLIWIVSDFLMIAGLVVLMLVLNWRLALATFAVAPLAVALIGVFRFYARKFYREIRKRIARLSAYLNECLMGMPVIQLNTREPSTLERFRCLNDDHRQAILKAVVVYSFFYPAVELVGALALAVLLAYGGMSILGGTLTFGTFLAFWYCAQKFFEPIRDLAEKYNILQSAMAAAERLFGILDAPVPGRPAAEPVADPFRGEVEFNRVSFSYDGERPVLEEVSLRVAPGEKVALVGMTGAGKTTLAHLLVGFYEPTGGEIRVDGRPLWRLDLGAWRRQVAIIPQDVFLFSGSVAENLRLGEDLPRERLVEAVRAAHLDEVVARLPQGLETSVRQRGVRLSAGQRQLLSIARALVRDPRVLVLDEATSSVDSETERLVADALSRLLAGRTCLLIAHRLSTVRRADRIVVVHKGRLREEGTHEELARRDGLYARFLRLQGSAV